jgi:hypothetical protein
MSSISSFLVGEFAFFGFKLQNWMVVAGRSECAVSDLIEARLKRWLVQIDMVWARVALAKYAE